MKYFFETYGCQMNKAESSSFEQLFLEHGWAAASGPETADFIVINTCSVRATAESRIDGRLGFYTMLGRQRKKAGKPFTLAVVGCMAERLKEKLLEHPVVDIVAGPDAYRDLPRLIASVTADELVKVEFAAQLELDA